MSVEDKKRGPESLDYPGEHWGSNKTDSQEYDVKYQMEWIKWVLGLGVSSTMAAAIIEAILMGATFTALE